MSRRHEDRKGPRKPGGRGPARERGSWQRDRDRGPQQQFGSRRPRGTRRQRGVVVTPSVEKLPEDGKVRLNRWLAMAGVCSRRAADELIESGRVSVNGEVVKQLGLRIDPEADDVRFDDTRVRPEKTVHILFNKPKGIVCTNARHEQKKRVIDLLPEVRGRIYTVGRLDLDSEGLILVTNDGEFAMRMTHPRYGVPKTYAVLVRGQVKDQDLEKARGGVWLAEGRTGGMRLRIVRTGKERTYIKAELREGKNREIRRVFARIGFPVISLKRVRIGELTLHGLGRGKYRFLGPDEVSGLLQAAKEES
jgi:23S rRNA pseudouridine2605 synthase